MKNIFALMCAVAALFFGGLTASGAAPAPAPPETTTYATWLMVWNGHTESWWKPTDYDGAKVSVSGKWQAIDWADNGQIAEYLDNCKKAGIQVVIADLTNGWGWLDARCQFIQLLCAQKGLKFCVAENSSGDTAKFEAHAQDIWNHFAGPQAAHPETYFVYHGKPLIVCYGIREWVNAYRNSTGPNRSRFNLTWSSGEDSEKDKWGWQLEPWIGSVPSRDSMFVTSSVKWSAKDADWRKSLACLDYNFALAKEQQPAFIIVGSYDDISERNSWLVADTSQCLPGRQMRDKSGALSSTAYYDRVTQWIAGMPPVVLNGPLRDGAYRIVSRSDGKAISLVNTDSQPHSGTDAAVGAAVVQSPPNQGLNGVFWLYHLGHSQYRIIALHSGLALEAPARPASIPSPVVQNWETEETRQRWTITALGNGWYHVTNEAGGQRLSTDNDAVVLQPTSKGYDQQWHFKKIIGL